MGIYVSEFLVFMMVFARITAMVVIVPMFGHQAVPVQAKVAIGLFLGFVVYPLAANKGVVMNAEFIPIVLMALKEIAVGLSIGFFVGLIFAGVRFAGELISMDTGLAMAAMFDPEQNAQTTVLTESLYLLMLMVFLTMNGHHFVLEAIQLSYAAVPMGEFPFTPAVSGQLIRLTGFTFVIAVKLAAPVLVSMFLINLALSILSRVMPQMNIFAVAFPIKLGAGFAVIMVSVPLLVFVFTKLLAGFEENILELVKTL